MKTSKTKIAGSNGLPQAWIALKKNRQKSYSKEADAIDEVFLKDKQEFQIELYNPTKLSQLVKIQINGSYISDRGLILEPGQRWFLDRYIDNDRKFSFSTYMVDDNEEVRSAISNNGLVQVEFYSEVQNLTGGVWAQPYWYNDWNKPFITYTNDNTGGNLGGPTFTTINIGTTTSEVTLDNMNVTNLSNNVYYTSAIDISEVSPDANMKAEKLNSTLETGKVSEGSKSKQKFENASGTFNSYTSNLVLYKLMPISTKPVEKGEIRSYCTGCGNRIRKSTWKFCPSCGEDLQ